MSVYATETCNNSVFTAEYMSAPLCLKIIEESQGHISPKNQKETMILGSL